MDCHGDEEDEEGWPPPRPPPPPRGHVFFKYGTHPGTDRFDDNCTDEICKHAKLLKEVETLAPNLSFSEQAVLTGFRAVAAVKA